MRNKRAARRNIGIEIDPQVIGLWRENNHMDIELVHGDAVQYLKGYEFSGKELVYCDPPYLRETRKGNRRVYKYEYTVDQHAELLEVIKALSCKVMISGYESELYKEQLRGWHTHTYQASCQHGVATEWIWMNYSSPLQLHDYSHLGDNSRQRERIKKKTAVWMGKLQGMPALQRQALLSAIEAVYGGGG